MSSHVPYENTRGQGLIQLDRYARLVIDTAPIYWVKCYLWRGFVMINPSSSHQNAEHNVWAASIMLEHGDFLFLRCRFSITQDYCLSNNVFNNTSQRLLLPEAGSARELRLYIFLFLYTRGLSKLNAHIGNSRWLFPHCLHWSPGCIREPISSLKSFGFKISSIWISAKM